ncbi:MAG: dihydrolipoyl dehydrogenase [Myxococcota bacterium]
MSNYDVIVIGSGPGGYVAAVRAGQNGLKCAIVEKDERLGGTCLLRGCIPTKSMLHSADLVSEFENAKKLGLIKGDVEFDWSVVQSQRADVVKKSAAGVDYLMKTNKVDVHKGFGSLKDKNTVVVEDASGKKTELTAKNIVLATGSIPKVIPPFPIDGKFIVSSDEILELKQPPKSLVVLGAGAVGTEFASVYSRFGTEVTLVEMMDRVLPIEDPDVSKELQRALKKRKIDVRVSTKLEKAELTGKGVKCTLADKNGKTEVKEVEMLLVAIGRTAVTGKLNLDAVGVDHDKDGYISVDEYNRTSVPNIYAIGDILRTPWLAHVASAQAILAVDHMSGKEVHTINYRTIPNCTYCHPEVASVGLTEPKAKEMGYEVKVGKFPFSALGKARVIHQTEGFVKIITDAKYDEIIGVHMIGPHVTDMLAEGVLAMQLETTGEELAHVIHPHPTLSEAVLEAAHGTVGKPIHI